MSALQRAIAERSRQAEQEETQWQQLRRQMEEKNRQEEEDEATWQRARWQPASKAFADGTYELPEVRIPVILTPGGPISSAKHLQRLAGMESEPKTMETTFVMENCIPTTKAVKICHRVMFRGEERHARVVRSLKEGASLPESEEIADNHEILGKGKAAQSV
ncbi:hypothetical protein N658DRAFT_502088 [Parathielavia hyrcaniae]|uniref:Uncharacterized protein n=1 Tax=Parathielavia hyrcaniae TaxID=113614 RepID=A0AAN6SW33_9PEZI|nr:hypothetical protein N658DRAFT_502088 [Parathielavia hyrcaniae]